MNIPNLVIPDEIQSLIDRMANHLAAQGQQSIDLGGACLYRGPNDLKCAIGALLSDEACVEGRSVSVFYDELFTDAEGTEPRDELEQLRGSVSEDDFITFLERCQNYHDRDNEEFWFSENRISYKGRISEGSATVDVITEDLKEVWRSLE